MTHYHDVPPPRIPFLWLVAGWLLLAALDLGQSVATVAAEGREVAIIQRAMHTVPAYLMLAVLSPLVFAITRRFSLEPGRLPSSVAVHAAATLLFPIVHLTLSAVVVSMLTLGGTGILALLQRWSFFYLVDVLRYWALVLLYQALWASRRARLRELEIEHLRAREAEMQALVSQARLDMLSAQLRPHFLFNALNVVSGLALKADPEAAASLLARLSDLLRRSLRQTEPTATLGEEMEFVRAFLDIEQARLGDRLDVSIDVPEDLHHHQVPSFLLQPIVENAILHGIAKRSDGGAVTIRGRVDDGLLRLEVENTGASLSEGPLREGVGLSATRQRLRALCGTRAGIELEPAAGGGGARAVVVLPAVVATQA